MSREHPSRGLRDYAGLVSRPAPLLHLRVPDMAAGAIQGAEVTVTALELRGHGTRFEVLAHWRGTPPHGAPPEAGPARSSSVQDHVTVAELELARRVAHDARDELARGHVPDFARLLRRARIRAK